MSVITEEEAFKKPMPSPDGDSMALWEGLKEGKLLLQNCKDCGDVQYYRQEMCCKCLSDNVESFESTGRGTIHSYSVVHRAPGPAFKADVPYAVLLVELEEGPRMISSLVGSDPNEIDMDMKVELVTEKINDDIYLPRFKLAE